MTGPNQYPATAGLNIDDAMPLRVMKVTDHLSLATMPWKRLATLVPDPRKAEDAKALQYASPPDRQQAELRNEVQRMIHGTKKAENAPEYAKYIANGLRGTLGNGWSTPPMALWFPEHLVHRTQPGPFGDDHVAFIPFDLKGVLVDAETQHLAHVLLVENPEVYGITAKQVNDRIIPLEVYYDTTLEEARQIFHDRNLFGVIPNKTVALNSDSRDIATQIANMLMNDVYVEHPETGHEVPLRTLVSVNKRQLGGRDVEWMTLSTLRSFVVTFLYGRAGFDLTSAAINPDRMPLRADTGRRVTEEEAREEALRLGRVLFPKFQHLFSRRRETVIGAPAVLAAIGAVAHRSASWSKEPRRTTDDFMALLTPVIWEKSPKAWDGIAGKVTPTGNLSLAGGVKDNGSKTATALEDSTAESFGQIRGSHIYS